ncbi:M23 family metallopeptidase [Tepidibacillus fermentans]|uniref:Murein DD-endopeptidase MepM/ murein hydrolase activator NlpD n=1 Tax=Tepidibacillus fermentans TaxID=1281767 RepID=A0A4R3KCE5_9BACI|nr:M23 family metallopeptidase [Tepidibacillus fermentans]TCS80787.1 murein DD-endopeptidase MepM/ murein hydrolase activator NlpD [Tepidibacillus fermentans]
MQSLSERFIEMKDKLKDNVTSVLNISKDRINNLQHYISENKKKSIIIGSLTGIILISSSFGLYYYQANATTLYHVYVDGKFVGTVNDKNVIERWKKEQLAKAQTTYGLKSLDSSNKVTYQEETVFKGEFNNNQTIHALNKIFHIEAVGTAIVINGKQVGVVKDKATADRILDLIKQGYLPKTDKNKIKAASLNEGPTIKVDDVTIKEKVSLQELKVSPDEIMSEEDLLKLIKQGTLEQKKYKVQEGDTISDIANKHGLTTKQLYQLNPGLSGELIHIGDELNVTAMKSLVTVLVKETVVQEEPIPYAIEYQNDSSMYKGQTRTVQTGKNGSKLVTYDVYLENGVPVQKEVRNEQVKTQPVKQIIKRGTKVAPSRGSGSLIWPAYGGSISSPFGSRWGEMHEGIDITSSNHTVRAADSGVISFTGWKNGYGNTIIINHNNGIQTLYAHLNEILVSPGTRVDKGQTIGIMGDTGRSTGTHLHFEVHIGGGVRNPLNYVRR